ncbi:PASTA domain-containing protein [Deinococcus aluminii]|uniref:PASTA domain-containing protein n=1 Tax=Deinococcus aluminii TaxID=1656885 RepID=A0ABP9XGQ6_9DEIO
MTNPSNPAGGFGRTLQELFTAAPVAGHVPVLSGPALVEVPDLTGDSVDAAQQKVRDHRLTPGVQLVETDGTVNTVRSQDPPPHTFLRPGGQVTLFVISQREPTQFEQMIDAIRQAIKPEELAKTSDVTAAVGGLARTTDVTAAVQGLAKSSEVAAAVKDLKDAINAQGGKSQTGR